MDVSAIWGIVGDFVGPSPLVGSRGLKREDMAAVVSLQICVCWHLGGFWSLTAFLW